MSRTRFGPPYVDGSGRCHGGCVYEFPDGEEAAEMSESLDLEAIKARADAATPGPWESPSAVGDMVFVLGLNQKIADCERITDAKFVAHAREDVPALLERIAALEAIARLVADEDMTFQAEVGTLCVFCLDGDGLEQFVHTDDCPVTRARALLDEANRSQSVNS